MASGLKIAACTASLNLETCFSISSAEKLSETSQPVSSVRAPRLAPPEMKRRRVRSGMVLTASLISSVLSTPGIRRLRMRPIVSSSTTDDHGAQALRHQECERDMNHHEGDDQRHADEMDVTRGVVTAEQRRQILQLHRLPDRKTRQHNQDADHDHAGIQE